MASPQPTPLPSNVLQRRSLGRRPPLRGMVLLGRYRVDAERARTRIGVVHEAFDLSAKRRVSVEVGTALEPGPAQGRFVREAMVAQRLEGERILRVLDTGRLHDGTPFVVREAAVTTLGRELEARGTIPVTESVGFVLDAAEAIAEGHALGLSHGRIDLDTVMLARDEVDGDLRAKVAWTSSVEPSSQRGQTSRDDERAFARDIRDLGRTLSALTSRGGDDAAATLPAGLASVVARAIAPGSARFAHIGDLAAALAPFAPQGHASARNIAFLLARAGHPEPKLARKPVARGAQTVKPADRVGRDGWVTSAKLRPVAAPRARAAVHRLGVVVVVLLLVVLGVAIAMFIASTGGRSPALGQSDLRSSSTTGLADDVTAEGLRARSSLPAYAKENAPKPALEPTRPQPPPAEAEPERHGPTAVDPEELDPVEEEPAEPPGIHI